MSDDLGRVDIGDFVANRKERLFHVGRLDADTEGLLILTNDGDLAHRLQHPQAPRLQHPGALGEHVGQHLEVLGVVGRDGPLAQLLLVGLAGEVRR